jgi:hypothetical protein
MSEARKNRFAPSLEPLESPDGPSSFSLGAFADSTLSKPSTPIVRLWDRPSFRSIFTVTVGARVEGYAESRLNQTVRWEPANYGNEQCTDLVLAALHSAGAKTNQDLGPTGLDADYVCGTLALQRTAGSSGSGQWNDSKPGDNLQLRDVMIVNPDGSRYTMRHHSAIVEKNLGNGRLTVLEQSSNGHHYVEEHTLNLGNMTQGRVWAYPPVAR